MNLYKLILDFYSRISGENIMRRIQFVMAFIFILISTNSMAYFGDGGGHTKNKKCNEPKISQIKPAHLSVVASQSEFSFWVSSEAIPRSIEVTVKKIPVEITIKEVSRGYLVSGKLPASLKETFARIEAKLKDSKRCSGSKGWLLNIRD